MAETKPDTFTSNMTVQFRPAAIYIKLTNAKVEATHEVVESQVMIDYDKDGNAVGVEVLP